MRIKPMKYKLIIDKNAEEEIVVTVHSPSSLTKQIEDLVQSYSGFDGITVYSEDELRRLSFDEIECITVIDRKVLAIDTQGKRYRLQDRLRDLENVLPSYFIRINKSTIANEHRILRFNAVFSGGVDAVFQCGYRDYVSRRCFSQIRRRYEGK
jgi:DNA-binding LytR/AlgR family response regulator